MLPDLQKIKRERLIQHYPQIFVYIWAAQRRFLPMYFAVPVFFYLSQFEYVLLCKIRWTKFGLIENMLLCKIRWTKFGLIKKVPLCKIRWTKFGLIEKVPLCKIRWTKFGLIKKVPLCKIKWTKLSFF